MMERIVNLNRFKKTKRAAEAKKRAAENRVRFGRSKTERRLDKARRQQTERTLDGKRVE